uniref:CD99 antigen-like protein 2 n=1 Tax=Capra hircus TaxID=9925 RepID=A0A8C2RQN4_CAPHI
MLSLADLYFVSPTFSKISTMDIPHLKTNNKNCITVRGIVQTETPLPCNYINILMDSLYLRRSGDTGDFRLEDAVEGTSSVKRGGQYGGGDNSDSGMSAETGTIAGVASALAMALIGAVSSYISYQQKKFCFSIQRCSVSLSMVCEWNSYRWNLCQKPTYRH